MLDYKLLEALAAVIDELGFDRAARRLGITQSAVSQRIRLLEETLGQILLIRTTPPAPTRAGRALLTHYRQVHHLEQELTQNLPDRPAVHAEFSIGLNADSLATWFLPAVRDFLLSRRLTLDLHVDDQDQTFRLLKDGLVWGCISSRETAAQGCTITELGRMSYRLCCTPGFAATWFPDGLTAEAVGQAPIIRFNRDDELNNRILARIFSRSPGPLPTFHVPSSEKFVDFIKAGLAYGALPDLQFEPHRRRGLLVDCAPSRTVAVRLYWHCWNIKSTLLQAFTDNLVSAARSLLAGDGQGEEAGG